MFTGLQSIAIRLPRGVKAASLALSLVFSALLTAVALRSPDDHWLAWISFLPLFVAVRWLRPPAAALAGGLWGACLYLFSTLGPTSAVVALAHGIDLTAPAIGSAVWYLALLIVIPAVYVGLAARPSRCGTGSLPVSWALKLLTLALGWTLVEVVVDVHNPSGRHDGPLAVSQGEGPHLHWLARLLGYVCTAFVVACANASLVGILAGAGVSFPAYRALGRSLNVGARHPSQVGPAIKSWGLRQAQPRAPPIHIAVPKWNLVDGAHLSLC